MPDSRMDVHTASDMDGLASPLEFRSARANAVRARLAGHVLSRDIDRMHGHSRFPVSVIRIRDDGSDRLGGMA